MTQLVHVYFTVFIYFCPLRVYTVYRILCLTTPEYIDLGQGTFCFCKVGHQVTKLSTTGVESSWLTHYALILGSPYTP